MSDSFFGFNSGESRDDYFFLEEEDDTDYDALNSETFGEDAPSTDWEKEHELLASELEKNIDDENNELCERVSNFVLDDEGEEAPKPKSKKPFPVDNGQWVPSRQKDGAPNQSARQMHPLPEKTTWWPITTKRQPNNNVSIIPPNNTNTSANAKSANNLPPAFANPPKILTVEELERSIKMRTMTNVEVPSTPTTAVSNILPYAEPIDETDAKRAVAAMRMKIRTMKKLEDPSAPTAASDTLPYAESIEETDAKRREKISIRRDNQARDNQAPATHHYLRNRSQGMGMNTRARFQPHDRLQGEVPVYPVPPNLPHQYPYPPRQPVPSPRHHQMSPPRHAPGPRGPRTMYQPEMNDRFAGPAGGAIPRNRFVAPPPHHPGPPHQHPDDRYFYPSHVGGYRQPGPPHPGMVPVSPQARSMQQGPSHQGPPHQGPPQQGPPHQGPHQQGPPHQGPHQQGPPHQGPLLQGPAHQNIDEYQGLMTHQEKQWLVQIQMMQLNTSQPYQDDFYYMMYQQRQQGGNPRRMGNFNNRNAREGGTGRPNSTYTPLQFENSLGKLQIGSVTAPRRIIDTEFFENVESSVGSVADRRSKQILHEIENLFDLQLKMEEIMTQYHHLPEESPEKIDLLLLEEKIMMVLLAENKLVRVMSVSKGKNLIARLLYLFDNKAPIVHRMLMDFSAITSQRRDTTDLLCFLPAIRGVLQTFGTRQILTFTKNFKPYGLLSSQFATSVMANLIFRAEELREETTESERTEWTEALVTMAGCVEEWRDEFRPVVALDPDVVQRQMDLIHDRVSADHIGKLVRALSKQPSPATRSANQN